MTSTMALRCFEKRDGDASRVWYVRREGIRCFLSWGAVGGGGAASTSVRDSENDAIAHVEELIAKRLADGYVEVPSPQQPDERGTDVVVIDAIRAGAKHLQPTFEPVFGFADVVCHRLRSPNPAHGFREYFVLRDAGRSAVWFTVKEPAHDDGLVREFLEVVRGFRDLPFSGRSHHKVALEAPIGRFTHALFCWPALGTFDRVYPNIAGRVGRAFPIHDCEIGDDDTEVLVDARINGRSSLASNDWAREPKPVIDLRFSILGGSKQVDETFKVYDRKSLERLLTLLQNAEVGSWLEARSFRGAVRRLMPAEARPGVLDAFFVTGGS